VTDQHKILAVLGVGAVAVLIYLMTRKATASNGSLVADAVIAGQPTYPNTSPIKMGDIEVGGSPINLTYNTLEGGTVPAAPIVATKSNTGGCGGCDDSCEVAGQKVSQQKISPTAYQNALDNFSGWAGHAGTA
jgi:hypothetical protein